VAAAEGYWRAFNTNGTPEYHPAEFFPNVQRLENGYRTTDVSFANNPAMSAPEQFDTGFHVGRNIWDLRYPVVDEEYGVVMSFARFGLKAGFTPEPSRPGRDAAGGRVLCCPLGPDLGHPGGDGKPRRETALGLDAGLRPHARRLGSHHLRPRLPHTLHRCLLRRAHRQ
jgi:hypothetical protein